MLFPGEVEALSYRGPNFGNTYEDSYPVIVAGKGAEIPGIGGQKDADFVSKISGFAPDVPLVWKGASF